MSVRTPGFESNDLAFLTRADYIWYNANVFRYWSKPTRWYRDLSVIIGGQQQQNFDGDITDRQAQVYVGGALPNFWRVNAFVLTRPKLLDDRILRGGPVVERPGVDVYSLGVNSDSRRAIIWNAYAEYAVNDRSGYGKNLNVGITWRPVPQATVTMGPSWNDSRSILQYVRRAADPTSTAFYGSRYIMASIAQKQLGLETRINWTFSPTTSFELFAQPLVASGDYYDFKEFDAPARATSRCSVSIVARTPRRPEPAARPRRSRSIPMGRGRQRRSPSRTRTSTSGRFAGMRCSAGSSGRGPSCTWPGPTPARRPCRSATSGWGATPAACSRTSRTTSSS